MIANKNIYIYIYMITLEKTHILKQNEDSFTWLFLINLFIKIILQ
jgi:hypothetical protein